MKGIVGLFLGLFGTFAFSWLGLTVIPNAQIGHLDPQSDEEGTDIYPMPPSGMAERGRHVYVGNGCMYCHSQQVRPDYAASDVDRKWGERRSAPRDYIFARPALLGKMRLGPDLSNVGKRAPTEDASPTPAASPGTSTSPSPAAASPAPSASPATSVDSETKSGDPAPYSAAWHHRHLYSPRSVNLDSNMPAYRFLYEKRRITGEPSADAVKLAGADATADGFEIVPTYEAKCLVAYLMSLDQSHPLKEVKSAAPAGAPSAAAKASPPPAAAAPPK